MPPPFITMTYESLLDQLLVLSPDQLKMDVTIYDCDNEEYYKINSDLAYSCVDTDVLDTDQPIIYL